MMKTGDTKVQCYICCVIRPPRLLQHRNTKQKLF